MSRTVKRVGPYAVVTFDHKLAQTVPGQFVYIDGKPFAIYDRDAESFSIMVKGDAHLTQSDPVEIGDPQGTGFPHLLDRHAIVVAGGTGIGAVMSVINARNLCGLSTDAVFYTRGDISSLVETQACLTTCGDVVFWDTQERGRPSDPLSPITDIKPNTSIFMVGPKSLTAAIKEQAGKLNLSTHTNY